jgi:hypothetical protein
MASPQNIQMVANFGIFMLTAAGIGMITGTTLAKTGFISREKDPFNFWGVVICHLALGIFCYLAQFFVK